MKDYNNIFEVFDDMFNDDDGRGILMRHSPRSILSANPMNLLGQTFFGRPDFFVAPSMRTDVVKTENGYELTCELPGVKKEDINIEVKDHVLKISASVSENREVEGNENERKYIKRERYQGSFSRSFGIEGIDEEKIAAKFENGILTINLVEKDTPEKGKKNINID